MTAALALKQWRQEALEFKAYPNRIARPFSKMKNPEADAMAPWLRAPTALPEDPGWIPSTDVVESHQQL